MSKKKKFILVFAAMLCILALPLALNADTISPQASRYISSTNVAIQAEGNGKLYLYSKVVGTGIMDQIGVKTMEIQTLKNGSWQTAYTIVEDDYRYNTGTYVYTCYYTVIPGNQYRSYVEFYVAHNGGSETKIVTSSAVTAK